MRPPRETAILVGLELKRRRKTTDPRIETSPDESLEELADLAESAGAEVLSRLVQSREAPEAATLIGAGKLKELAGQADAFGADVVVFDHDLSPTQLRNLEKALPCKVVDRTQLILDIFARRARTREGQLQVELAQLNYLLPRLTGRGVAMSRLGGGIGTRGPGETQLETDRRRIFRRIKTIRQQLDAVRSHRSVQRRQRQAVPLATLTLVGYTNAGKSTLFNRLTGAGVAVDSKMFATLDPTVRQLGLPSHRRALISDTVGFIRSLPTTLVKAFRATLEEVREAALLLHVVDASSPHAAAYVAHVKEVLEEIEASTTPQILVLNKIDLVEGGARQASLLAASLAAGLPWVCISARSGEGMDSLLERIDELLAVDRLVTARFRLPASAGAERSLLHQFARVLQEEWGDDGCLVEAETPASLVNRLSNFLVQPRHGLL